MLSSILVLRLEHVFEKFYITNIFLKIIPPPTFEMLILYQSTGYVDTVGSRVTSIFLKTTFYL